MGDKGMAAFVVGNDTAVSFAHHDRPQGTKLDPCQGILETIVGDVLKILTGSAKSCFINKIGEIGSGHTCRQSGQAFQRYLFVQGSSTSMNFEDGFPPHTVRVRYSDVAVKAARTQQGFIQDINAVSRGKYYNCIAPIETIELDQQLVEGLIALVVAGDAHRSLATDCINLIDKDDARRRLAS